MRNLKIKNKLDICFIVNHSRSLINATAHNKDAARSMLDNKASKLSLEDHTQNQIFVDLMKRHTKLYHIWRRFDLLTALFALSGLVLALVEYEIGFMNHHEERDVTQIERSAIRLGKH